VDVTIIAKILRLKLIRMIDILKRYILNLTVMANKTLLKTIKITISNYFIYMLKVAKLFFKPFLLPFIKLYK